MPLSDPELWKLIETWPLPSRAAPIPLFDPFRRKSFSALLYESSNWTDESVERVIAIYRKFLYLMAISRGPITSSKDFEAAWRLHLKFGEDYLALCRATGRDLRRLETLSKDELDQGYLDGLALYEAEFDVPPEDDLWPSLAAIADRRAYNVVGLVVFFAMSVPFLAAASTGSVQLWLACGLGFCIGSGVLIWAGRRWPRSAILGVRE
jgi:hypothetical protein